MALSRSFQMLDARRHSSAGAFLTATAIAALVVVAAGGLAQGSSQADEIRVSDAPPEPPPFILRDVAPRDAIAVNARIPFSASRNIAADPFVFRGGEETRARAIQCLTLATYYEAGDQDPEGQEAVAQVVLNRVRNPAFPNSICGVVFQGFERKTGCQFTFTCDGSLLRTPNRRIWSAALEVARAALDGAVYKPVGLATHYHANYVVPYWATSLEKNAQVGLHIFYRWPDAWGAPSAFRRTYSGQETDPQALRAAAVMSEGAWKAAAIDPDNGVNLAVDPRLELLAVVQLLANHGSNLAPSDLQFAKDVESYFVPEKDHRAVQLFRQLSSTNAQFALVTAQALLDYTAPPELAPGTAADRAKGAVGDKASAEFIDALRDFARSSEFNRFFRGHRPFYNSVVRRTQRQVGMARAYWRAYTLMPLDRRSVFLTSLATAPGTCGRGMANSGPAILSLGSLATASNAEILLATDGPQAPLAAASPNRAKMGSNPSLDEQVIRAVFARITALTQGDANSRAYVEAEVARGYSTVPALEQRLRENELRRNDFQAPREFASFLSGLESQFSPTKPGSAAKVTPCADLATASAAPQRSPGSS